MSQAGDLDRMPKERFARSRRKTGPQFKGTSVRRHLCLARKEAVVKNISGVTGNIDLKPDKALRDVYCILQMVTIWLRRVTSMPGYFIRTGVGPRATC